MVIYDMDEKVMRVFVGALIDRDGKVYAADTLELLNMGRKAKNEGAMLGCDIEDVIKQIKATNPRVVIVEGGLIQACVKKVVASSLLNGATEVKVPLSGVRSLVEPSLPEERKRDLKRSLGRLASDSRLKIIP